MKYKVGDRVILKDNKDFDYDLREIIKKIDYIATIKKVYSDSHYAMEELTWRWSDYHIEGLAPELDPESESETNRFELMDFE